MEEKNIITTETVETEESIKETANAVQISPEHMLELLGEVNDMVAGYELLFTASKDLVYKLSGFGYDTEVCVQVAKLLNDRASDKASKKFEEFTKKDEKNEVE